MIFICSLRYSSRNKAIHTFLSTFQTVKPNIYFILVTPNRKKCTLWRVKLNINYNLCTLVTKLRAQMKQLVSTSYQLVNPR